MGFGICSCMSFGISLNFNFTKWRIKSSLGMCVCIYRYFNLCFNRSSNFNLSIRSVPSSLGMRFCTCLSRSTCGCTCISLSTDTNTSTKILISVCFSICFGRYFSTYTSLSGCMSHSSINSCFCTSMSFRTCAP